MCLAVGNNAVANQSVTGKPAGDNAAGDTTAGDSAAAGDNAAGSNGAGTTAVNHKVVDAVGYGLAMTPCASAGSSAHWHKQRASSGIDSHGAVMIANDRRAGLCITAQGGRVDAGAAVIAWPCKASGDVDTQLFKL